MKTLLTLDVLKTMSIDELEDSRAAGEDFRRELTHAVMRVLHLPSGWSVNGEYRSEFGGFFPVQIRFSPAHCHFDVAVCSATRAYFPAPADREQPYEHDRGAAHSRPELGPETSSEQS